MPGKGIIRVILIFFIVISISIPTWSFGSDDIPKNNGKADNPGPALIYELMELPAALTRSGSASRAEAVYESASEGLPTASPSGGDSGWTGIDLGDFNGDGFDDLVAVGRKGFGPEPYISDGTGKWTYSRTGITSPWCGRSDLRIVDVNQDDKLDIVTSDSGTWLGDGTGKWTEGGNPSFTSEDVAVGDINNDNKMDIAMIGHLTGGIKAFFGDGNGNWIAKNASNGLPASSGGHKINLADVNNDNNLDIIASHWYDESVYLGDGKGNWTVSVQGMAINNQFWGVATGDINNDSNIDIALTVFDSQTNAWGIHVYKGDGTGKWTNASSGLPTSGTYGDIELADMNNDGNLDIVAGVNGFGSVPGSINMWFGDGTGQWTIADVGLPQDSDEIEGLDVGDMNNDGYQDIGISYYGEDGVQVWSAVTPKPVLVQIDTPNGGESIRVGTDYKIKWIGTGGSGILKAKLEYSTTGPSGPFNIVTNGMDNTGTYTWTTPLIESTNCYIKISINDSTVFHSLGSDVSNASFELYKVPIKNVVISPDPLVVIVGDKITVTATSYDNFDSDISGGVSYSWSVKGFIGSTVPLIDPSQATFSATKIGSGNIAVTADYFGDIVSAEIDVIVPQTLDMLKITPPELYMIESNTYEVSVEAYDVDRTMIEEDLLVYSWSIKGFKAEIISSNDQKGVTIKALDAGTTDLEIKIDHYNMSVTLTETIEIFSKVYAFGVNPTEPVVKLGENMTFKGIATGVTDNDLLSLGGVEWTIDSGGGTVEYSPPGLEAVFTPESPGHVKLNATLFYLDDILVNITDIFVPQPLSRIRVEPNSAFIYYGDTVNFNITAFDTSNFKIYDEMKLRIRQSVYLGDVDTASDGHSFSFTAFGQGAGTLTVTVQYFGYNASATVDINVPPAVDVIAILPSKDPVFAMQTISLTAEVTDLNGASITKGLEYNWSISEDFSNVILQDHVVTLTPLSSGISNVTVEILYYGKRFERTLGLEILASIDNVVIEISKDRVRVSDRVMLNAKAFNSDGELITDAIEFTWESPEGTLDRVTGENVYFNSNKRGLFSVKVTATLSNYRTMTGSGSISISVEPENDPESFWEKYAFAVGGIAVAVGVIICLLIFFMVLKKKARKRVEDERILVPEQDSALTFIATQPAPFSSSTPATQVFPGQHESLEAAPGTLFGPRFSDKYVNYGEEQQVQPPQPVLPQRDISQDQGQSQGEYDQFMAQGQVKPVFSAPIGQIPQPSAAPSETQENSKDQYKWEKRNH